MTFRIIFFLVPLAMALPAMGLATTWYVDGSTGTPATNCTDAQTPSTPHDTIQEGLRCPTPGVADSIVEIAAGTYTVSSTYGNVGADTYGGGTTWMNATIIRNAPGELVTFSGGGHFNIDEDVLGETQYIIFEADAQGNMVFDDVGLRVEGDVHHLRFRNLLIKNYSGTAAIQGGNNCTNVPHDIEIQDNEFLDNGATFQDHDIYPACSLDWLVERNKSTNVAGYFVHFFANTSDKHNGAIIRYNVATGRSQNSTNSSAIIVRSGLGTVHKIYGNVVYHDTVNSTFPFIHGVMCGLSAFPVGDGACEITNNSFHTLTSQCVQTSADCTAACLVHNNACWQHGGDFLLDFSGGEVIASHNSADQAGTGVSVVTDPLFNAPTSGDLTPQFGSPLLEAGTTVSFPANKNGALYDIGAYEALVFGSGIASDTAAITYENALFPPLLPASACTGFSVAGIVCSPSILSCTIATDIITLGLSCPLIHTDVPTYSYSAGNVTGTAPSAFLPAMPLHAITNQALTNEATAPADYTSNLVLYLKFDSDLLDSSGQANHGSFSGGSPTYGSALAADGGDSLDVDGVDDLVTITEDASFDGKTLFTFAAWVELDTFGEISQSRILDFGGPSAINLSWLVADIAAPYDETMVLADGRYATTDGLWTTSVGSIALSTVYHLAVTYDSTTAATMYINGIPVTTIEGQSPAGAFTGTTSDLHVGNNVGQTRTFEGRLDNVRVYVDRLLSAQDIAALYTFESQVMVPLTVTLAMATPTFPASPPSPGLSMTALAVPGAPTVGLTMATPAFPAVMPSPGLSM